MDIYEEVHMRQAERFARRQARLEREARRERIIAPIKFAVEVVMGAVLLYAYLFLGALWASI